MKTLDNGELEKKISGAQQIFLFLDYDGTLTPIVDDPDDAMLSTEMRELLSELSNYVTLTVISGRGLDDVKSKVELEGVYYAGSHGFEIEGPEEFRYTFPKAHDVIEPLHALEKELQNLSDQYRGVALEKKKFSLAVHYRKLESSQAGQLTQDVEEHVKQYDEFVILKGKKVIEVRPALSWNKGRAVNFLLDRLSVKTKQSLIIYMGDDTTDEDAFRQKCVDIGILVGERTQTYAAYQLKDVDAVYSFLKTMLALQRNDTRRRLADHLHRV